MPADRWNFAERDPAQELALLHHFSVKKIQDGKKIEFLITVRERGPSQDQSMRYFAQADKQTNQKSAPYTPSGWGSSLLEALSRCIEEINRFPYEGE